MTAHERLVSSARTLASKVASRIRGLDRTKLWRLAFAVIVLSLFALSFSREIALVTADLGRHLKNGELFAETLRPLTTNHYSFTDPGYPVVTHHWGTGVIYHGVWKLFGFAGLSILNVGLGVLAVALLLASAWRRAGFGWAMLGAALAMPLVTGRAEVRPEIFSYLLLALYYVLLRRYQDGDDSSTEPASSRSGISFPALSITLIGLQLLWVNLHIFFLMGPFLVAVFALEDFWRGRRRLRPYLLLGVLLIGASLINPWGFRGLVEPFTIDLGYRVAEDESVFYMQRFLPQPVYWFFEALFLLALAATIAILARRIRAFPIADVILLVVFGLLGVRMIRGIPLFGLFFIASAPGLLATAVTHTRIAEGRLRGALPLVITILILGVAPFTFPRLYRIVDPWTGIGLIPNVNASAGFMKGNRIPGPIFNNYDVGGFLIYHLYPDQRVFVDNRAEAYRPEFFRDVYEPMQADEAKWREIDERYGFNCILFYRHDRTAHAQEFLLRRIDDPEWAPVFVDAYTLVLLRRNERNARIVERLEIPGEAFRRGRR